MFYNNGSWTFGWPNKILKKQLFKCYWNDKNFACYNDLYYRNRSKIEILKLIRIENLQKGNFDACGVTSRAKEVLK